MRYTTAGESHGRALTALVTGVPAGIPLLAEEIDRDLARRQQGYGRGGRQSIETDRVTILSGVRFGSTIGSPIALAVTNRDWDNWTDVMSPSGPSRRAFARRIHVRGTPILPACSRPVPTTRATSSSARVRVRPLRA